jgi:putative tricarboxylic transport membrane protein
LTTALPMTMPSAMAPISFACAAFGYLLNKFVFEVAPMILGFVLGPMFEVNLRRSLLMSQGSFAIFVERPIALVALTVCMILIILPLMQTIRKRKSPVF